MFLRRLEKLKTIQFYILRLNEDNIAEIISMEYDKEN